jgi:hypothetical protein
MMAINNKYSMYFDYINDIASYMFFNHKKHPEYDDLDDNSKNTVIELLNLMKVKYGSETFDIDRTLNS